MDTKQLVEYWKKASFDEKQKIIRENNIGAYKNALGHFSFRIRDKLRKSPDDFIPTLNEEHELCFVKGYPVSKVYTQEEACLEQRQYRAVAVKEDGEEEYSAWYDKEDFAHNIKNEIDELEAYESTYVQKRIKGDKDAEASDEAVLEKKCKKKKDVKESSREMDTIRNIRQELTNISSKLAQLTRSNTIFIKNTARKAEREIDKIRQQLFDIQENFMVEKWFSPNTPYDSTYVIDQLRALANDPVDRAEMEFLNNLADKIFQSYPDRVTLADIENDIRTDSNVRRTWDNDSWLYAKDQIFESRIVSDSSKKHNLSERNNIVTKLARELVSTHLSHLKGKQMGPSDVGFIRQVINDTLKAYPSAFRNVDIDDLEDMVFDMLD